MIRNVQPAAPRDRPRLLPTFALALALALVIAIAGCASTPPASPITKGSLLEAPSGTFTLHVPVDGWNRFETEAAEEDDRPVVIALARDDGNSSLQAFHMIDPEPSLDSLVADRRTVLLDAGAYDFREKRRFLGEDADMTVSMARYRQNGTIILVVTAIQPPNVVELIGFTARGQGTERELIEIMESVRIVDREADQ